MIKKIFALVFFLLLVSNVEAGRGLFLSTSATCADVPTPVTDETYCIPMTGSSKGKLLRYNGAAYVVTAVTLSTDVTGTLPVANGGTGLTSGTSGGVLAFTGSTTLASSGALTANLPVIGGGAGVAPTVGTRSGNTTAYVTTTGAQTSGDCVKIDANGNHVANGSACGSGATSAAGSDTHVQFNDGGTAFGGDAGLVYNKTTDALTVGALVTVPKFTLTREVVLPVTETDMSGNVTLSAGSSNTYQFFNTNGSNRDVTLPSTATGLSYFIMNTGAQVITVKDAGASTVATIASGAFNTFIYSGSAWRVI